MAYPDTEKMSQDVCVPGMDSRRTVPINPMPTFPSTSHIFIHWVCISTLSIYIYAVCTNVRVYPATLRMFSKHESEGRPSVRTTWRLSIEWNVGICSDGTIRLLSLTLIKQHTHTHTHTNQHTVGSYYSW